MFIYVHHCFIQNSQEMETALVNQHQLINGLFIQWNITQLLVKMKLLNLQVIGWNDK